MPTPQFDTITEALNLSALPESEQKEILLDIDDLVFKGSLVRLIDRMNPKARAAFAKLIDASASGDEIETFIRKNVPDADEVVKDTIEELTSDILAVTQE